MAEASPAPRVLQPIRLDLDLAAKVAPVDLGRMSPAGGGGHQAHHLASARLDPRVQLMLHHMFARGTAVNPHHVAGRSAPEYLRAEHDRNRLEHNARRIAAEIADPDDPGRLPLADRVGQADIGIKRRRDLRLRELRIVRPQRRPADPAQVQCRAAAFVPFQLPVLLYWRTPRSHT